MASSVRGLGWVAVLACGLGAEAQQGGWTVKPEWVRAHEEFLASDVMAGRGSATRDEEIAAMYVASEFMGYGLKPAPGMTGYLQGAEVTSPALDGHATLAVGEVTLTEGADFFLLNSPGTGARGTVVKMGSGSATPYDKDSAAVVTGMPAGTNAGQFLQRFRRAAPALVVIGEDDTLRQMFMMVGGKTRTPMRLNDVAPPANMMNIVVANGLAMEKLRAVKDGAAAALEVHVVPEARPRETYNAIGYLPGIDAAAGTILLTAHLDHLGVGKPVNGDAIYNGANDDAAGTTAVLELAHALAAGPRLRRSILFVCYGSEEAGELGSTYFGEHPPVPLKDLVTNLEFEMIGTQDPKMPKGVLLFTGWARSNLGPTLKAHGALVGPDPYPEQHFFERSDNYALALKGVVAHTAAGWGTPPTYHQPSDDLAHLDLAFMTIAIQSLVEPVRWLADSDFKPEWNKGGQPKGR